MSTFTRKATVVTKAGATRADVVAQKPTHIPLLSPVWARVDAAPSTSSSRRINYYVCLHEAAMQPFLAFLRAAAARYARRFLARRCRPVPAVQRRVFHVTTQSIRSPPPIFSASLKRMLASQVQEIRRLLTPSRSRSSIRPTWSPLTRSSYA